jgi:hypothetical protein
MNSSSAEKIQGASESGYLAKPWHRFKKLPLWGKALWIVLALYILGSVSTPSGKGGGSANAMTQDESRTSEQRMLAKDDENPLFNLPHQLSRLDFAVAHYDRSNPKCQYMPQIARSLAASAVEMVPTKGKNTAAHFIDEVITEGVRGQSWNPFQECVSNIPE